MGYAVPHSVKLQEEYGDDLAVLFVEVQNSGKEKSEAFALKKKWLGGRSIWTTERPFSLGIRGIPQFALLSPEGEIVLSGHNSALQGEMEDRIEDMVKSLKKGPASLPKKVAKAWAEMAKGGYAKSLAAAEKIVADAKSDEDVAGAKQLIATLDERVGARVERIRWMLDNGYPLIAAEQLKDLSKGTGDRFDVAADLSEMEATLASDEFKQELKAAQELTKIEQKLFEDPDAKHLKKLTKFLEQHGSTKVAKRAEQLRDMTTLATS